MYSVWQWRFGFTTCLDFWKLFDGRRENMQCLVTGSKERFVQEPEKTNKQTKINKV